MIIVSGWLRTDADRRGTTWLRAGPSSKRPVQLPAVSTSIRQPIRSADVQQHEITAMISLT